MGDEDKIVFNKEDSDAITEWVAELPANRISEALENLELITEGDELARRLRVAKRILGEYCKEDHIVNEDMTEELVKAYRDDLLQKYLVAVSDEIKNKIEKRKAAWLLAQAMGKTSLSSRQETANDNGTDATTQSNTAGTSGLDKQNLQVDPQLGLTPARPSIPIDRDLSFWSMRRDISPQISTQIFEKLNHFEEVMQEAARLKNDLQVHIAELSSLGKPIDLASSTQVAGAQVQAAAHSEREAQRKSVGFSNIEPQDIQMEQLPGQYQPVGNNTPPPPALAQCPRSDQQNELYQGTYAPQVQLGNTFSNNPFTPNGALHDGVGD